jgi:hypothetical protein
MNSILNVPHKKSNEMIVVDHQFDRPWRIEKGGNDQIFHFSDQFSSDLFDRQSMPQIFQVFRHNQELHDDLIDWRKISFWK